MNDKKITEKLLFAVHYGQFRGKNAGVIMSGSCLPIAVSHPGLNRGYEDLWQSEMDVDYFFEKIGMTHMPRPGLWVVETSYAPHEAVTDDPDDYVHLMFADIVRSLNTEELENMREGGLPWPKGAWL